MLMFFFFVEKRLLKNYFFISTRHPESNRGMVESHMTAIWQSFSEVLSYFSFLQSPEVH